MSKDTQAKWACQSESVDWPVPSEVEIQQMSRRERMRSRGPYTASAPPFIAGLRVDIAPEVAAEASEASTALTRFDASISAVLGDEEFSPLSAVLLRTESASSSQIEQITAGAKALALASIGESDKSNAALVAANAAAMETAIELSDQFSAQSIVAVQSALLSDSAPLHTGGFRDEPVWIGAQGSSPHSASFVAPHHDRVADLITDLVEFADRTDISPFVQVALAHAQFETIHPFTDGNGRTGRALVQAMLRTFGVTQRVTVPVSAGLLSEVEAYYAALTAYRRGDLNPIVTEFSRAAFAAIANGTKLVEQLAFVRHRWAQTIVARTHASVWRMVPLIMSQPAVTVAFASEKLQVSQTAAQHAIDQLVTVGALTPASASKRNRVWVAAEIIEALDAFAARAGRRRAARG